MKIRRNAQTLFVQKSEAKVNTNADSLRKNSNEQDQEEKKEAIGGKISTLGI